MPDEQPSLHIDTDWKKQAQEEKRRLSEEEQKRSADREQRDPAPGVAPIPGATPSPASTESPSRAGAQAGARAEREVPPANLSTLISSLMTQVLLYLGDLSPRGAQPQINLDLAKFNVDLLGVLEEKTRSNLSPDEQRILDNALYETRMRYVSVASQYATV